MHEKTMKEITMVANHISSIRSFQDSFLHLIRKVIDFDAACFTTIDPISFLSTGAFTDESVEKIHPQLFMNEFLEDDFNKFKCLTEHSPHVASLSMATNGEQKKSSRYRNILKPANFGDELRGVCMSKGKCYGHLSLFRGSTSPAFHIDDCKYLATIVPIAGEALKKAVPIPFSEEKVIGTGTGTIIVSEEFNVLYWNQDGSEWLSNLRKYEQLNIKEIPRPIRAVCSKVKANEYNVGCMNREEKVCLPLAYGHFLIIRASKLEHTSSFQDGYIVLFERARPEEIFPLIMETYSFTMREKQVIRKILTGMSTKELAQEFCISIYTVQDHLKSIFEKTGVSSRNELVWEVFSKFCFDATE
ncbi:TPA: helix-turn-helix transcriptional regulator [Bacillus thuringiensis]|uniref:helix-turn-helix transcriptional regulator n=1 Tax=Bacillus sp. CH_70 TaxID=2978215 RepID=UPI0030FC1C19|nr:helix-turn-helix transcriptional regulator [Bacillus thuringiensis]